MVELSASSGPLHINMRPNHPDSPAVCNYRLAVAWCAFLRLLLNCMNIYCRVLTDSKVASSRNLTTPDGRTVLATEIECDFKRLKGA